MSAIDAKYRRESLVRQMGRFAILIMLAGFFTFAWGPGSAAFAAEMEDYCQIPPYVKRDVTPNIMILMDNSDDMFDYAHWYDNDPEDTVEDGYDPTKTYVGYFNPNLNYSYGSNVFVEDPAGDFPGNLMNWATMSKYDIVQKVLLGGNSASKQGNAHTLVAIDDVWQRTYDGCTFDVNNGSVTISGATCSLLTGGNACAGPYPDDSLGKPSGKGVEIIQPSSTTLPDGQVGVCYEFGFQAKGGESTHDSDGKGGNDSARYTWSISANPDTLTIDADSGIIHGIPATAGSYSFTVTVDDDGKYAPVSRNVTLVVQPNSGVATEQFSIKVEMIEDPLTVDNNGNDIWDEGDVYTDLNGNGEWDGKKGIIHEFWDDDPLERPARWGMTAFGKAKDALGNDIGFPSVDVCMDPNNSSSFYTAIQNATPAPTSPLADGLYGVINYIKNPRLAPAGFDGCTGTDPFGDKPCRPNFVLMLTSGSDITGEAFPGTGACNEGEPLVQNACYGANTDLRDDADNEPSKQVMFTYIVQTFGKNNTQVLKDAANAGEGVFYSAGDGDLDAQLRQAFRDMLKRAAAGSAASVLASGEGSGANMLQAVFYPRRKFIDSVSGDASYVTWTGRLSSFWYYIDPWFSNAGIREDNASSNTLDLAGDNIVQFYFDEEEEKTKAKRWTDTDGDGIPDGQLAEKDFEMLDYLWEAGQELQEMPVADRKIYVNNGGTVVDFEEGLAATALFQSKLQAADQTDGKNIINYVRGVDDIDGDGEPDDGYRSRTVTLDGYTDVWKLGDILTSTPQIVSWTPRMDYHIKYKDTTYGKAGEFPSLGSPVEDSHFITTQKHKDRGTAIVGANDGMLHAFKIGTFEYTWDMQDPTEKARLTNTNGIGKEQWAFIPENVLPYLKYLRETDYCHLYSVDLTPYVFDASIGSGVGDQGGKIKKAEEGDWRTVVIGSMRLGGGCGDSAAACTDCVKRPGVDSAGKEIGYSSYFALDVTETLTNSNVKPTLLWEFTHDKLGFASTGPAVFRVGERDKNGDWYVLIASGPTGPIDKETQQFMGRSNQNLHLFVLNLKTGNLEYFEDTLIPEAFAGTITESSVDTDLDYKDEAVYVGYVQKDGAGEWETGGVLRLFTEESGPGSWSWEKLIDGIGPVTSRISRLHDKRQGKLWLYFGTGRYFFNTGKADDDPTNIRRIYGIKEPRYNGAEIGSAIGGPLGALNDVTGLTAPGEPASGWYINLDSSGTYPFGLAGANIKMNAERVITDPLATTLGVAFFVTYMPYEDVCAYGGKSFIWALQYNTGGVPKALLRGKALVQTSTGSIEQKDLSQAFTEKDGKRTGVIEGVPPTGQGLSIMTSPPPINRVLHRRER